MKLQMKKWSCKWKKWSLMAKGDEQKWKNEDKMKKNDNENDNENENGNENENEKTWKNNKFWWSQTVAVRIL